MPRQSNRLSARTVATVKRIGRHADGGGLYLYVAPDGGKRWTFIYHRHGKRTEIGFGAARDVPLTEARQLADKARTALREGRDPKAVRKPRSRTFAECADKLIAAMRPGWSHPKHAAQWEKTLGDTYCRKLRPKPVTEITTDDVLSVLNQNQLWTTKPETASRLRGRIERVLNADKAHHSEDYPAGWQNPARWRGHLKELLQERKQLPLRLQRYVNHYPSMPYAEVPTFLAALRERPSIAALALEFLVLTAVRPDKAVKARWDEFDLDAMVWAVEGGANKGGKHRVPLPMRAVEIVKAMQDIRQSEFVFPGTRHNHPLSDGAMNGLMKRMKVKVGCPHGFRSSFRDWAAETTSFSREVCEAALAHAIKDKSEAAYRRGDLLDKRRKLMEAWATFCAAPQGGKVVAFKKR